MERDYLQTTLIEPTRMKLFKVSKDYGYQSKEAMRLSMILDVLINLYNEEACEGKRKNKCQTHIT
ncbi:aspartyl-phosphate phosphatase Spo0E family protein [Metabacillus malikii]|uniref:Aspartyl-phosphate phosphatase Spo0E family protein n=1 Tax=Metabacillus malikii TaxID=1504265 RepID=A0ABT9ZNV2_9BACI|nr:aspartyl-phosphate phosphatase Spo0E family protein [Metabacillus malikii]MDQ0233482.1 hypothetical protein [Metabacillus malikii]